MEGADNVKRLLVHLGLTCGLLGCETSGSFFKPPSSLVTVYKVESAADEARAEPVVSSRPETEMPPSRDHLQADEAEEKGKTQAVANRPAPEEGSSESEIVTVGLQQDAEAADEPEIMPLPESTTESEEPVSEASPLELEAVIASVYRSYPSLEAAFLSRDIAAGELLSAQGAFDLKLKAASENSAVGFYQNYRQSVGLVQPLVRGGEAFAGYRVGNGSFEPWYKERETNEGGEFKTGVSIPLAQNRGIDPRRAELWKSDTAREMVEPEIQAQLISFVQAASLAYWEWVAAGENYQIAENILDLARERTSRIRNQVEEGFLDPPELTDNLRLVAEREAKLAESSQKLQKAAIKLSLYYRDQNGDPVIPAREQLPEFSSPEPVDRQQLAFDADRALQRRPELAVYNFVQQQLQIDHQHARNQLRPELDAVFTSSQDIGHPASPINDKGEFQFEASVFLNVPLQRRKARGKLQSVEAKISQVNAKRELTENRIVAEVQTVYAELETAYQQVRKTRQAVEYAADLARRERRNFEEGASDLLKVTLREQYAVEAQLKAVEALLNYYQAKARYRAALAQDQPF